MSERRRGWRFGARVGAAVVAWLVIGATVNVGVAWWGAWRYLKGEDDWLTRAMRSWPAGGFWPTKPPETRWPIDVPESWPEKPWGGATYKCGGDWLWSDEKVDAWQDHTVSSPSQSFAATSVRCGWPCASLSMYTLEESGSGSPGRDAVKRGQWEINGVMVGWKPLVLPTAPLWRGFIPNTLIYSAATWTLWSIVPLTRRWRRRKRGLCVGCGYDLRGLADGAVCPECGRRGR